MIRAAAAVCDGGIIHVDDLARSVQSPAASRALGPPSPSPAATDRLSGNPLKTAEREALLSASERNRWNMSKTAEELGISRGTLYRKLKTHQIPIKST